MQSFSFFTTQSILCEPDASLELAQRCAHYQVERVQIVTDPGIVGAGLLQPVIDSFNQSGLQLFLFDQVEADPSEATVLAAYEEAKDNEVQLVVGFGGGSAMDVAKVVAVLAHPQCYQSLHGLYGVDEVSGPRLPLIQVPTTAGTGSEVTPIAVITTGNNTKAGIISHALQADLAVLDAKLTLGLPASTTAATGIDAMVHGIEAYTSVHKKNPLSDMLACKALELLSANIETAVFNGHDLEARSNMLLGAMLAGQAFANAPVAAVHALAYPLGTTFHLAHGLSNALVLPHVMRFNLSAAAPMYAQLAPLIMATNAPAGVTDEAASETLIQWLQQLMARIGLPAGLRECGVSENDLPGLASDAMLQQRLLVNNPCHVSEQDALQIYKAAF